MSTPQRLVAVDVETTGFSRHDRVVEIAVVEVDPHGGRVVDEFETLINPLRDVGPVHVHGVTAEMVSAAPTFDEVVGPLARRLHGATLVAHNLPFDVRFLRQELDRLGTQFEPGSGFCTLAATSQKLSLACKTFGISLGSQHRALADARATAELAALLHNEEPITADGATSCRIGYVEHAGMPRTLRRPSDAEAANEMVRAVSLAHYPFSDEALLHYADVLDWALDDHEITAEERNALRDCAADLGINDAQVERVHVAYFNSIVAAALRDHIVTPQERLMMERVALALNIPEPPIPEVTELPSAGAIELGTRVCFTGSAIVDGAQVGRKTMEEVAADAGLDPVSRVTKSACDLLVAADPASSSGKTKAARRWDIPVISTAEFFAQIS